MSPVYTRADDGADSPARRAGVRTPEPSALEVAALIKERLGRRTAAPVRLSFVSADRATSGGTAAPPLAQILRGGRGGEVRLKLELTFLWFAVNPPHDLNYPARAWATLLGLEDPEGRGVRRVRQGIAALAERNLVFIEQLPGRPSRIYLRDESGSGAPYELPGKAYNAARNPQAAAPHRYIQLPDQFWTRGWISVLSGAAVAMLLVLYAERGNRSSNSDLWFSPKRAGELYGLGDDTRSKGLRELRVCGLVTARQQAASRDALDFRRRRNTYRIVDEKFADLALVPTGVDPVRPLRPAEAVLADMRGRAQASKSAETTREDEAQTWSEYLAAVSDGQGPPGDPEIDEPRRTQGRRPRARRLPSDRHDSTVKGDPWGSGAEPSDLEPEF